MSIDRDDPIEDPGGALPRRLDKFLSDAQTGARSLVALHHAEGALAVNGDPGWPLWRLVDPERDEVRLHGLRVEVVAPSRYGLLHKPAGVLTAMRDASARPVVADLVPEPWRGLVGPVGRLDAPTTGALLLTDDGDLSALLTRPDHHVFKRYVVSLARPLDDDDPRLGRLRGGLDLDDGPTLPARAGALLDLPGLWIEIQEGRKRQVRRMIRSLGLTLTHLHRSHIGPLALGDLPEGHLRPLSADEIDALYESAGGRGQPRRRALAALRRKLTQDWTDPHDLATIRRFLRLDGSP